MWPAWRNEGRGEGREGEWALSSQERAVDCPRPLAEDKTLLRRNSRFLSRAATDSAGKVLWQRDPEEDSGSLVPTGPD